LDHLCLAICIDSFCRQIENVPSHPPRTGRIFRNEILEEYSIEPRILPSRKIMKILLIQVDKCIFVYMHGIFRKIGTAQADNCQIVGGSCLSSQGMNGFRDFKDLSIVGSNQIFFRPADAGAQDALCLVS